MKKTSNHRAKETVLDAIKEATGKSIEEILSLRKRRRLQE
jgi:hypothetical protein